MSEEQDRHSKALDVELIADPIARAEAEAKNGIRQFDAVVELIDYFLSPDRKVRLRPSHLLHLHRIALEHQLVCWELSSRRNRDSRQPPPAGRRTSGARRDRRDVRLRQ
jgi:hypothetical protein